MNNIVDPMTNEVHSIFSNHGTYLLKKYVTLLQNGGSKKHKGKDSLRGRRTEAQRKKQLHKQKNVSKKKRDQAQNKKKKKLERFLEPFRNFISNSPNSSDFEENVIDPILQIEVMTPEEIRNYLIQGDKSDELDEIVEYLNFSRELKNSGASLGKGTPLLMMKSAIKKDKPLIIRALLFITAIILAVNTVITYVPEDMVRKMGDNSKIPTEIAKHDNMQWDFYDENQWGSFKNIRDEELRNSIASLSSRPDLVYDTKNLELLMKVLQEGNKEEGEGGEGGEEEGDEMPEEGEEEGEGMPEGGEEEGEGTPEEGEGEGMPEGGEESSEESSEDMPGSTQ